MVQGGYNVALSPGDSVERHFMDTIEGGKWLPNQDLAWTLVTGAIERIHELENELGCFFDRNPDGTIHQKAFAGPDVRSHRAQGRPHRHRDHEPPRRTGVGARHRAARGASRARLRSGLATVRFPASLLVDIRVRRARVRAGEGGAARDRRRSDDVSLSHAVGRQELRRARDGAALRIAAARHGDGAVPSDGAPRRTPTRG